MQAGMLKMEQRLGSSAVGPPPLIMMTLWTRSGYSCARKVQKETLLRGYRMSAPWGGRGHVPQGGLHGA